MKSQLGAALCLALAATRKTDRRVAEERCQSSLAAGIAVPRAYWLLIEGRWFDSHRAQITQVFDFITK
jgi:hypothetical protein